MDGWNAKLKELNPQIIKSINAAVAKKTLTTEQGQAITEAAAKQVISQIATQIKDLQDQITVLKGEIEKLKGH